MQEPRAAASDAPDRPHVGRPGGVWLSLTYIDIVKRCAVQHELGSYFREGPIERGIIGDVELGMRVRPCRIAQQLLQVAGELPPTARDQRSQRTSAKASSTGLTPCSSSSQRML